MKALSDKEIETIYGKYSFFNTPPESILISSLGYIHGIPFFDKWVSAPNSAGRKFFIHLSMRPNGMIMQIRSGFDNYSVGISREDVLYFVIEAQQRIFDKKSKSVVGRAIAGVLIAGPLGAIIGGLSGIGNKEVRDKSFPDNILTIGINHENVQYRVLLSCDNSILSEVRTFLSKNFQGKEKLPDEIIIDQDEQTSKNISVSDEIMKLKQLLDEGIITSEEFTEAKKKLLM